MAIRPRVHILSKKSYTTDLFWFISCLRLNQAFVFSVNNTARNLPVKVNVPWGNHPNAEVVWMNGHVDELHLLRKLKHI